MDYGAARAADVLPKAKAHALKAVELDDSLAEAHASLGAVSEHDYDWKTAERELQRAIELRPGYATAHQWHAEVLSTTGRLPQARAEAERARQLDPSSPIVNHILALTFFNSREYDRTIEQETKALELDPTFFPARVFLILSHLHTGNFAGALAHLDRASDGPIMQLLRAQVLAATGDPAAARRLLTEAKRRAATEFVPPGALAAAHLALGEKEEAFAFLEKGVDDKNPLLALTVKSTNWDPIRADPRFQTLLRRMNLE